MRFWPQAIGSLCLCLGVYFIWRGTGLIDRNERDWRGLCLCLGGVIIGTVGFALIGTY